MFLHIPHTLKAYVAVCTLTAVFAAAIGTCLPPGTSPLSCVAGDVVAFDDAVQMLQMGATQRRHNEGAAQQPETGSSNDGSETLATKRFHNEDAARWLPTDVNANSSEAHTIAVTEGKIGQNRELLAESTSATEMAEAKAKAGSCNSQDRGIIVILMLALIVLYGLVGVMAVGQGTSQYGNADGAARYLGWARPRPGVAIPTHLPVLAEKYIGPSKELPLSIPIKKVMDPGRWIVNIKANGKSAYVASLVEGPEGSLRVRLSEGTQNVAEVDLGLRLYGRAGHPLGHLALMEHCKYQFKDDAGEPTDVQISFDRAGRVFRAISRSRGTPLAGADVDSNGIMKVTTTSGVDALLMAIWALALLTFECYPRGQEAYRTKRSGSWTSWFAGRGEEKESS